MTSSRTIQCLLYGFMMFFPVARSWSIPTHDRQNAYKTTNEVSTIQKFSEEQPQQLSSSNHLAYTNNEGRNSPPSIIRRDECFSKIKNSLLLIAAAATTATSSPPLAIAAEDEVVPVFKNPSGLKYIELQPGTGPTPRYGQLVSIKYTAYLKLPTPDSKPEKFDSATYLIKHGNGKTIPGLDEGLHTLKVGGKRRLIIPPKLGFIESGLGPLPEYPWDRWKLNNLLGKMIEMKGGNLIFEIELLCVRDDEADQGYYEDLEPTPEEIEFIQTRLLKQPASKAPAPAPDEANLV